MRRNSEIPLKADPANLPVEQSDVLERSPVMDTHQGSVTPAAGLADANESVAKPNVEYGRIANYS